MTVDIEQLKQWLRDGHADQLRRGRTAAGHVKEWVGKGRQHIVDQDLSASRQCAARAWAYQHVLCHILEQEQEQTGEGFNTHD